MADVFTPLQRSRCMAAIRGSGNKQTELRMLAIFRRHGIRGWRRHFALFGRPDFTFPRERVAVFVDGCFWHACPAHCRRPSGNADFWNKKLERNKARDREVTAGLRAKGWKVLRFWEHALRNEGAVARRVERALERSRRARGRRTT